MPTIALYKQITPLGEVSSYSGTQRVLSRNASANATTPCLVAFASMSAGSPQP